MYLKINYLGGAILHAEEEPELFHIGAQSRMWGEEVERWVMLKEDLKDLKPRVQEIETGWLHFLDELSQIQPYRLL